MRGFTMGVLAGGTMMAVGMGCLLRDKKACRTILNKGKRAAVKTENMVDDMVDDIMQL